ncbi:MAG: tautomerase family protein [Verrucomicrobia bacterium]|nr:tautomerase family protein [Verrucomicrobiota bacterium]
MPTYHCTAPAGRLSAAQKAAVAEAITRTHHEVTGAPGYFAEVIFHSVAEGDWFVGGQPLRGDQIFVHGHIRAGRSAVDRQTLLRRLVAAIAEAAAAPTHAIWVYLAELPGRAMVEFGHILPEPGDEAAWAAALPPADRQRMESIGRRDA